MKEIWLIFTRHEEIGLVSAPALLGFLDWYQPDTIFLELPPSLFNAFYSLCNPRSNLESRAVIPYRAQHPTVNLVPVDIGLSEDFERDSNEFIKQLAAESHALRQLLDEMTCNEREQGFPYLNSEESSQRWAKFYVMVETIAATSVDPVLAERLESWISTHECRDQAMLHNIRQYCREHTFDRAVFLVGAAHSRSVIEKVTPPVSGDPDGIQWRLQ